MSAPTLRPYQVASQDAVATEYLDHGQNRLLLQTCTGGGKTVTFSTLTHHPRIARWWDSLPEQSRRVLVIAHREELLDQAAQKMHAANPEWLIGVEQGDRHAMLSSDVVIASIQTLAASKYRRLKRLITRYGHFSLVIVDEAHHASANTYRTVLMHLGFLPPHAEEDGEDAPTYDDVKVMEAELAGWDAVAPKDRLLLGVTATPNRSDAVGLNCVFQRIAYSYPIKRAIQDQWLVPIVPWVVETQTDLSEVRVTHGEFNQKDLAEAVNTERRNELGVAAWLEHAKGLPTIAFTVDVAHAQQMAATFRRYGIRAAHVSGETHKEERRQILADYTAGRLDVIANCMILTEGTDLPLTQCILHAKPTKSATLFEQMSGRGLRLYPGKDKCILIDLVDVARRHSLMTAASLYGLPPGLKVDGKDLSQAENELAALQEKYPSLDVASVLQQGPLTLAQLAAKASTFDIWTVPSMGQLAAVVSMNWIKLGEDSFRLQFPWQDGTEVIQVQKDMLGHFEVSTTFRPGAGMQVRQRTLASQVGTSAEALVMAEEWVKRERHTVSRLTDKDAGWRKNKASERQLGLLRKLRVPVPMNCTMGTASDLINMAKARGR